jgi:SOS-response transcriptional repressor LexA
MLTGRLRDVVVFIEEYQAFRGRAPTMNEIADGVGLASRGNVHRMIEDLEERGVVTRLRVDANLPNAPHYAQARTIRVLQSVRPRIPVYRAGDHKLMGYLP